MKKRRKLKALIITLVVLSVVGYLIYAGIRDTMMYYLTVPEVLAGTLEAQGDVIRVSGNVFPDSVKWDPKDLKLVFKIGDDQASLNVAYSGVVPDSFKPGREVVIEGKYNGDGNFVAETIMPKCASKYE